MMNIFSRLIKKDNNDSDFQNKYYILEVQLSYDYNNEPLIKLICTKILKRESDEREYINESRNSENVRYFFYPATEEYKDYFIMFARNHKPIEFKQEDFVAKTIEDDNSNKEVKAYIKNSVVTNNYTAVEKMMTPLRF